MNILIAEDDDQVRRLMAEVLEVQGYAVDAVSTVQQALGRSERPDLLILDRRLPNGDGKMVAQHFPNTPTLYISGYEDADLRKPFTMRDLTAAVVERIGK